MKPLPKLDDEAAMLLRGKRSAIAPARNEAAEELRNACTRLQSCDWDMILICLHCDEATEALERLKTLGAMWSELR